MSIDERQLSPTRQVKRVLGRVGRWSLKGTWSGLALIGFLHLTRGRPCVTSKASVPTIRRSP